MLQAKNIQTNVSIEKTGEEKYQTQAVSRASGTGAHKLTPVPTTLAISLLGALPPNPCLHHSDLFSKDIIV